MMMRNLFPIYRINCKRIDVNDLLPFCEPAPFRDFSQEATVVDTEIRNALECSAETFKLEFKDGSDPLEDAKIELYDGCK
jgi:hypothetical protein